VCSNIQDVCKALIDACKGLIEEISVQIITTGASHVLYNFITNVVSQPGESKTI
jgi:hypothetical protein